MKTLSDFELRLYGDIGNRIVSRRKKLGLSQREVANRMGVTPPSLANVEAGRQRLLVNTLFNIAEILDVSPAYLLVGDPSGRDALSPEDVAIIQQLCEFLRNGRFGREAAASPQPASMAIPSGV